MSEGNFAAAEKLFRAHLTKYIGWVHDHTLPARGAPFYAQLVKIDVDALFALADSITQCLARQGKNDQLVPFVDALERNAGLDEFKPFAIYLRALCHYIYRDDRPSAVTELKRLGDPRRITHSETLELYIDVFGDSLRELEKLPILEQILERPRSKSVALQYGMMRAVLYTFLGDNELAVKALEPVAASAREVDPTGRSGSIEEWDQIRQAARVLDTSFRMTGNRGDYEKAVALYSKMRQAPLRPFGVAELLRELGALQTSAEGYNDAVTTLKEALALDSSDEIRIRLVFALLGYGSAEEAAAVLDSIDLATMRELLQLEYWHATAAVAIARRNEVGLGNALGKLRRLELPGLYWPKVRDHFVEELSKSSPPPGDVRSRLARALRLTSVYLDVKPGLFGVALNLNAILDGLAERLEKAASKQRSSP
jgi:tetratricopeptide (TPR) repeat protein